MPSRLGILVYKLVTSSGSRAVARAVIPLDFISGRSNTKKMKSTYNFRPIKKSDSKLRESLVKAP